MGKKPLRFSESLTKININDGGFVKTQSEQTKTEVEAHHQGISKSSMLGIIASIIITIIMIYKGVELVTTSKQGGSKTSIAVLNFDNVRKFQEKLNKIYK